MYSEKKKKIIIYSETDDKKVSQRFPSWKHFSQIHL